MKPIKFSREETKLMVDDIRTYLREELEISISSFPAERLVEFFGEKMGAYFYNRGLYDAEELMRAKVARVGDAIMALEQPTRHVR